MIGWIRRRWQCFRRGEHLYAFDAPSGIGDYIRCTHCHHIDEYVPGFHEPKGYSLRQFLESDKSIPAMNRRIK